MISTLPDLLTPLNSEQRRVVEHPDGPLMVVAGAGTGKTRVITTRIAWLIRERRVKPEEILALTFADRAAGEMETRVDELVPYAYTDFWISTFHAFGDRVLREHALDLGISPRFRVLSGAEQLIFLREHLFDLPLERYRPLGNPTKHLEALLGVISRAKDEDVAPEEFSRHAEVLGNRIQAGDDAGLDESKRVRELAEVYRRYQELMAEEGKLDFGDLIGLTLKVFRKHPAVLAKYQSRFRYILVDEFQDTNYGQLQLLLLLGGRHRNVVVVGDDDQSIFKWRGAAVSNMQKFLEVFPKADLVVLTKNYRSKQVILDTAYQLIRFNDPNRLEVSSRISKKLAAQREGTGVVQHHFFDTVASEGDGIVAQVIRLVQEEGVSYKDIAVLVRSHQDAEPFLRAFNVKGIPWQYGGHAGLYEQEEIRWLLSFLRVLASVHDTPHVYATATSPAFAVPPVDLVKCLHQAHRTHRSLWSVLERLETSAEELEISTEGQAQLKVFFGSMVEFIDLAQRLSVGEVLYRFVTGWGLLKGLMEINTPRGESQIKNMAKFFDLVKRYTDDFPALRPAPAFVRYLDLLQEAGDDPKVAEADAEVDAVHVLTLHGAKGLEFPVVFMVSLVSDRFPVRFRREALALPDELVKDTLPSGDIHLQEERRLCYVGMTRAMNELHLSGAADYGGRRMKKVSQFVAEALGWSKAQVTMKKTSPREVIERFAPLPSGSSQVNLPSAGEAVAGSPGVTLSYYHLDDYTTCPLKYKFAHILRVPVLLHHSVVYGLAMHEGVRAYHAAKASGTPTAFEEVKRVFEASWRSEGFLSREHEDQRFRAGLEALKRFVETQDQSGMVPHLIEKEFTFFLDGIRVVGRWDRVDIRDPGEVVVMDFKASSVKDGEEANKRAEESVQLALYVLAYEEVYRHRPDRVELYFLDSGVVGSASKGTEEMEEIRERIRLAAQGIRGREFKATPSFRSCQYCVFREICPYRA